MEPLRSADPYVPDLRVGYLFRKAWPLYKRHLGLIVGAFVVYALATGALGSFGNEAARGLGSLLSFVLAGPMGAGLYVLYARLHRGEDVAFSNLFDGFRVFGRAVGVYALSMVLTVVGLLLLVVPGIVVAVSIWPALFLVLEEDATVTGTLQRAWDLTSGHRWRLFGLFLAMIVVTLLGLAALVVGVLFTGALALFVLAGAYDELTLAEA